jgi:hypothetical protein
MPADLSETGAKLLKANLVHLEKYTNLGGVKLYIEDFNDLIDTLQRCNHFEYPKLPPIADIPLDDLLKEIKRRVEYHPGPIG